MERIKYETGKEERVEIDYKRGKELKRRLVGICRSESIRHSEDVTAALIDLDHFEDSGGRVAVALTQHPRVSVHYHWQSNFPLDLHPFDPPYGYELHFEKFSNQKGEKVYKIRLHRNNGPPE